jgi:hypothetical protein
MRRLLSATVLLLAAAALLASSAAAKEMSVSLGSGPPADPPGPGGTWTADLLIHGEPDILSQATPGIAIRNMDSGETHTYAAKPTGKRAPDGQLLYRVGVEFPSEGLWRYTLIDGITDREYEGGTVQIGEPAAAAPPQAKPVSPAAEGTSLPLWPLALGGSLLVLAAVGAALAVRHRRPHPA